MTHDHTNGYHTVTDIKKETDSPWLSAVQQEFSLVANFFHSWSFSPRTVLALRKSTIANGAQGCAPLRSLSWTCSKSLSQIGVVPRPEIVGGLSAG